jgi:hypothetical protein
MPRIAFYVRLLPILVSLPLLLLAVRRSLSHRISFVPDFYLVLAYSFVLWYPPSWPIYIPNVCCCCFSSLHLYTATHMTKKTRSSYLQDWRGVIVATMLHAQSSGPDCSVSPLVCYQLCRSYRIITSNTKNVSVWTSRYRSFPLFHCHGV